jgi:hypothetical protein
MAKKFKYYEVTCTSMQVFKAYIKAPASIDFEQICLEARDIDGGAFVLQNEDWEYGETREIFEDSKMLDEPIEYIEEDFQEEEG